MGRVPHRSALELTELLWPSSRFARPLRPRMACVRAVAPPTHPPPPTLTPPHPQCAAAALDILATALSEKLLPFLLPVLHSFLQSENWIDREAGILALGAVAEGAVGAERRQHEASLTAPRLQLASRGRASWRASFVGCTDGLDPHLPLLLPFLFNNLQGNMVTTRRERETQGARGR